MKMLPSCLTLLCGIVWAVSAQISRVGEWRQPVHEAWPDHPTLNTRSSQRLAEQPRVAGANRISRPIGTEARISRRGRIVARIHSSELSIPKLHNRYSGKQQTATQAPARGSAAPACSEMCPPPWMDFVNNLRGLTENVTEPMCAFSDHFSACSATSDVCRTKPVQFHCCPSHCIPAAMKCYDGPSTNFLCVPKTVQPWMGTMLRLFALG